MSDPAPTGEPGHAAPSLALLCSAMLVGVFAFIEV